MGKSLCGFRANAAFDFAFPMATDAKLQPAMACVEIAIARARGFEALKVAKIRGGLVLEIVRVLVILDRGADFRPYRFQQWQQFSTDAARDGFVLSADGKAKPRFLFIMADSAPGAQVRHRVANWQGRRGLHKDFALIGRRPCARRDRKADGDMIGGAGGNGGPFAAPLLDSPFAGKVRDNRAHKLEVDRCGFP